jgi:hypothetical protein
MLHASKHHIPEVTPMPANENTGRPFGPDNPHPLSQCKTELVWEGKYDEYGNRRALQLPHFPLVMQKIETIDAPRDHEKANLAFNFDEDTFNQNAHRDDFRNRLIWGDNKLALNALLNEFRGEVNLIYVDPPFDVGADFTMNVNLGEEKDDVHKEQSILEAVAYRDMWGKGTDSYLHMMYERIMMLCDLLASDGSIYVHCDWRVSNTLRYIMDDVFGGDSFQNETSWCYREAINSTKRWNRKHDNILFYTKSPEAYCFNPNEVLEVHADATKAKYKFKDEKGYYRLMGRGIVGSPIQSARDISPEWEKTHPELVYRHYLREGTAGLRGEQ